ncbi:hypothetical protein HYV74_03205 [Candidatus Uhrbacteria bacterium]|nr:hypothetical protein [Candidatus Uhrbacteria bacterium]
MPEHPKSEYPRAPDLRSLLSEAARVAIVEMSWERLLELQAQLRKEYHPIPDLITMEHAAALTGLTVEEIAQISSLRCERVGEKTVVRWESLREHIANALRTTQRSFLRRS